MSLQIVAFVLPLGLDTFAISIALGLRGFQPWRPALTFAVFEGFMPVFGVALARIVGTRFAIAAVVVGGIILIGLGIHVIREALEGKQELEHGSFKSLRSSFLAGLAISSDELAIGFPMGASGLPIVTTLVAISVQALLITLLGITIGNRVGSGLGLRASRYVGIAAGIVFSLVGLWLIVDRPVKT